MASSITRTCRNRPDNHSSDKCLRIFQRGRGTSVSEGHTLELLGPHTLCSRFHLTRILHVVAHGAGRHYSLACFKEQLSGNPDLVPVWGCLVPALPFFYIFHLVSAGFSSFKCRFCPFKCRVLPRLEKERKIETVRKPSPSCPLKHADVIQARWHGHDDTATHFIFSFPDPATPNHCAPILPP